MDSDRTGQGHRIALLQYVDKPLHGVFDGQGFTIKGIRWTFNVENETTHLHGLFGAIKDATIKNLKLGAAGDQITLAGTSQNVVSAGALRVTPKDRRSSTSPTMSR